MDTKVAIIGSGFGMYGLLPAFNRVKGCKVVSICGKNSERMQSYCEKLDLKRYSDWRKMLKQENPDAVAIAVIPKHQYAIAKYALENGMAVFAEKPLSTSIHDSLELVKLAKKKNLPNMVDFIFPEIPQWCMAKKAIENGIIGKIFNIKVCWTFLSHALKNQLKSWKTDVKQGGGLLSFYFSHIFYYLEFFIGRIKNVQCIFSSSEKNMNAGETIVNMIILFENGCIGNAHMDIYQDSTQKHIIEFYGDKGTMILQNHSTNFVDNFELTTNIIKRINKIRPNKTIISMYDELEDPRVKVITPIAKRFITWCNTGIASKPDFQDGHRVQELIEMARVSNSKFYKYK